MSREIPILFSGPMVRAILEGRKNQTRRVVKPQPLDVPHMGGPGLHWFKPKKDKTKPLGGFVWDPRDTCRFPTPYGQSGDLLWVRETWQRVSLAKGGDPWTERAKAEGRYVEDPAGNPGLMCWAADGHQIGAPWKPSIHMPKWAARIWLDVTGVRVQRLQDISVDDAIAEGSRCWACDGRVDGLSEEECACFHSNSQAIPSYRALWESINGEGSWDANPWVWVVEFKRAERRAEAA